MKYKHYDIGCRDIGDLNRDTFATLTTFFWTFINPYKDNAPAYVVFLLICDPQNIAIILHF